MEIGQKHKKIIGFLAIVIFFSLIAGLIQILPKKGIAIDNTTAIPFNDFSNELAPYSTPSNNDMRNRLFPENKVPNSAFSELPEMPLDFLAVRSKYQMGQLPNSRISEKYWKQPEWYINWDQTRYLAPLENGHSTIGGYGAYPSEYIVLARNTDEFEVSFYAFSDFTSNLYIGSSLKAEYPASVNLKANYFPDDTRMVEQDSKYAKEHIKLVSIAPKEFLLEPARNFQIYEWYSDGAMKSAISIHNRFEYGWAREIKIKFKLDNLKAGKYAVVFSFVPPSDEFSLMQSSKYLTRYLEASSFSSIGWQFGVFFDVQT